MGSNPRFLVVLEIDVTDQIGTDAPLFTQAKAQHLWPKTPRS
jgi:hypothetical protein